MIETNKKPDLINDIVATWVYDIIKNNKKSSIEEIDNDKLILKDNSDNIQDISTLLNKVKASMKHKPESDEIELDTIFDTDDTPEIDFKEDKPSFEPIKPNRRQKNEKIEKERFHNFKIDMPDPMLDTEDDEDIELDEIEDIEQDRSKINILRVDNVKSNNQSQIDYKFPLIKIGYFNGKYSYLLFDKEKEYRAFTPVCGFYSFILTVYKKVDKYLSGKIEVPENMFSLKNKKTIKLTDEYNFYIEGLSNFYNEKDILYIGLLFTYKQNFSVTPKDKMLLETYISYFLDISDRQLLLQKDLGLSKLTKKELVPNIFILDKENYESLFYNSEDTAENKVDN